jgi:hypothetical protein
MDLKALLDSFTGGQPQQAIPNPQNDPQQQAPQSGGNPISSLLGAVGSPLGQSLLAGYFGAIGAPKLGGWGGALSRGGLTALNQYGNASELQQRQAEADSLAKYRDAQTAYEQQKMDLDKQEMPSRLAESQSRAGYTKAQMEALQAKNAAANAPQIYHGINPETGELIPGMTVQSQRPPTEGSWISDENWQDIQKERNKNKVTTTSKLQEKKDFEDSKLVTEDDKHDYLDPKTLQPNRDPKKSVADVTQDGFIKTAKKDAESVYEVQTAKQSLESLKQKANDVFQSQKDYNYIGGRWVAGATTLGQQSIDPEKFARWESEVASASAIPRKFLGGNRMNLSEFNRTMDRIAGMSSYSTSKEAVQSALDEATMVLNRSLKTRYPSYEPDGPTDYNAHDALSTGEPPTSAPKPGQVVSKPDPTAGYVQVPGGVPFKSLPSR